MTALTTLVAPPTIGHTTVPSTFAVLIVSTLLLTNSHITASHILQSKVIVLLWCIQNNCKVNKCLVGCVASQRWLDHFSSSYAVKIWGFRGAIRRRRGVVETMCGCGKTTTLGRSSCFCGCDVACIQIAKLIKVLRSQI